MAYRGLSPRLIVRDDPIDGLFSLPPDLENLVRYILI